MKNKIIYIGIVILIVGLLIGSYFIFRSSWKIREDRPIRILRLSSYHAELPWDAGQLDGFEKELNDLGIDFEIKNFYMDTKRKSSEEWCQYISEKAIAEIDSWNPDLIYATDDNVQKYIGVHYIGSDIPWVFSGMNGQISDYGFEGVKNIAGTLERPPIEQLIEFMHELDYSIKDISIITDEDTTGVGTLDYIKEMSSVLEVNIIGSDILHTYEEYQDKIKYYQDKIDAIILPNMYNFLDADGNDVAYEDVLEWTVKNSNIPEFSFWGHFISEGMLGARLISPYAQGKRSAKIVKGILIDGKSPSSFSMDPTVEGDRVINLARAKKLGLEVHSSILINSDVIEKFPWEIGI